MSIFCGACDLYDTIMMQKMYDKGSYKVSDELECFNIFKEKTGGVINQYIKIEVTKYNLDFIKSKCPFFDYSVDNKKYIYKYYNVEYKTLNQLNNHGVYINRKIKFNTLLDIIPYYPYIVCMMSSSEDKMSVTISQISEVDKSQKDRNKYGYGSDFTEYYRKKLQNHYLEVCKNYFLYKLDERRREISISNLVKNDAGDYELTVDEPVDYMHEINFVWKDAAQPHWTSPEFKDKHTIIISKVDVEGMLLDSIKNNTVALSYVAEPEGGFPVYLD